jgi:hypothetical protein
MEVSTVDLDLAKCVFQVHGANAEGAIAIVPRHQRTSMQASYDLICDKQVCPWQLG